MEDRILKKEVQNFIQKRNKNFSKFIKTRQFTVQDHEDQVQAYQRMRSASELSSLYIMQNPKGPQEEEELEQKYVAMLEKTVQYLRNREERYLNQIDRLIDIINKQEDLKEKQALAKK